MSYIDEINAFERWLETNYLPASSQLLWYKLLMLFNRCGWAEWVTVDNQRLMSLIQIKREKTFIDIRDKLLESGLIQYEKGKKGSPNRYKMVNLKEKNTFKSKVQTEVKGKVKSEVKGEVQTEVKSEVQTEVKSEVQTEVINRIRIDKEKEIDKDKEREKESKEKEYSVTAVEDTSKVVSSNFVSHSYSK